MPHGIRLSPPTQPIRRRFRPLVYRHAHIASHGHMSTSPNFLHPSLVDNPLYYSIPMPCLCGAISITSYPSQAAKQSTAQRTCSCSAIPSLLPKHHQPSSLPLPHAHSTLPSCLLPPPIGASHGLRPGGDRHTAWGCHGGAAEISGRAQDSIV